MGEQTIPITIERVRSSSMSSSPTLSPRDISPGTPKPVQPAKVIEERMRSPFIQRENPQRLSQSQSQISPRLNSAIVLQPSQSVPNLPSVGVRDLPSIFERSSLH